MEINLADSINPSTLLVALVVALFLRLWPDWLQRQDAVADTNPRLARERAFRLLRAGWKTVVVGIILIGFAYAVSSLLAESYSAPLIINLATVSPVLGGVITVCWLVLPSELSFKAKMRSLVPSAVGILVASALYLVEGIRDSVGLYVTFGLFVAAEGIGFLLYYYLLSKYQETTRGLRTLILGGVRILLAIQFITVSLLMVPISLIFVWEAFVNIKRAKYYFGDGYAHGLQLGMGQILTAVLGAALSVGWVGFEINSILGITGLIAALGAAIWGIGLLNGRRKIVNITGIIKGCLGLPLVITLWQRPITLEAADLFGIVPDTWTPTATQATIIVPVWMSIIQLITLIVFAIGRIFMLRADDSQIYPSVTFFDAPKPMKSKNQKSKRKKNRSSR